MVSWKRTRPEDRPSRQRKQRPGQAHDSEESAGEGMGRLRAVGAGRLIPPARLGRRAETRWGYRTSRVRQPRVPRRAPATARRSVALAKIPPLATVATPPKRLWI